MLIHSIRLVIVYGLSEARLSVRTAGLVVYWSDSVMPRAAVRRRRVVSDGWERRQEDGRGLSTPSATLVHLSQGDS